jgi:hypothetical protein
MSYDQAQEKIQQINIIYQTSYTIDYNSNIIELLWNDNAALTQKEEITSTKDTLHYLFALLLLYGKWESKENVLHGIKIQIPLITSTISRQQEIQDMIQLLQQDDFIIQHDSLPSGQGSTEQITSKDPELLQLFAVMYKSIEKWETISTDDIASRLHVSALQYLEDSNHIEAKEILEKSHYKILTKT